MEVEVKFKLNHFTNFLLSRNRNYDRSVIQAVTA